MATHLARLGRALGLCALLCVPLPTVFAAGYSAGPSNGEWLSDEVFEQGVSLTRSGQFEAALERFLTARKMGDTSARLQFNLGVVYYRLQRWPEAREAFTSAAADGETGDLARYNLGLVALAAGEQQEAARWFRHTARAAHEPALRALGNRALSSLGQPAEVPGVGSVSLLRGHDSNVVIPVGTVSDNPSSVDDQLLELRAGWSDVLDRWGPGLDYRLGGVLVQHDEMDAANIGLAEASLGWRGPVRLELGAGLLSVADSPYQRSVDARASWPLPMQAQWYRLSLDGTASRLDSIGARARNVDGWQLGAGTTLEFVFTALTLNLNYRHVQDDRRSAALSPEQDLLQARVRYVFDRWVLRAWGRYSHRQFPTPRRDESGEWGGDITYRMFKNWDVLVEVSRVDNQSSDSGFAFVSDRVYAGLRWRY